jgi:hypothetical protein
MRTAGFDELVAWWASAVEGEWAAREALGVALGVGADEIGEACAVLARLDELAEYRALVGTLRVLGRARPHAPGRSPEVSRLEVLRRALLDLSASCEGFSTAFARNAGRLLARRPSLGELRGRARLLEEVRRDLVREPSSPLPEFLSELLAESVSVGIESPPLTGIEEP